MGVKTIRYNKWSSYTFNLFDNRAFKPIQPKLASMDNSQTVAIGSIDGKVQKHKTKQKREHISTCTASNLFPWANFINHTKNH